MEIATKMLSIYKKQHMAHCIEQFFQIPTTFAYEWNSHSIKIYKWQTWIFLNLFAKLWQYYWRYNSSLILNYKWNEKLNEQMKEKLNDIIDQFDGENWTKHEIDEKTEENIK